MLVLLEETYAPPVSAAERRAFLQAAMSLMRALSLLGQRLARMPASSDHPGVMAGLTFTVPRNLGARGLGSAELVLERLIELSAAYKGAVADKGPSPVEQAYQQIERHVLRQQRT